MQSSSKRRRLSKNDSDAKAASSSKKGPKSVKVVEIENQDEIDDVDEDEPDVKEIGKEETCRDNHTCCVSDELGKLKEVFDEKTCLELLTEYYAILKDVKLPKETKCAISGCEFDYSSNTYRLMVTLSAGTASIGENFLIVKVDGATGFPKVLSVR